MTDAELQGLVQKKSPEQLTLLELEKLRHGLLESEVLRNEVSTKAALREYVTEAFGRVDVSLDQLLAQAPSRSKGRGKRAIIALVCLLLLAAGGLAVWRPIKALRTASAPEADTKKTSDHKETTPTSTDTLAPPESPSAEKSAGQAAAAIETPPPVPAEPKAETPQPPAVAAAGPWDDALRADAAAPLFATVAFRPFLTSKTTPGKADLEKWFTAMNAHAQFGERRVAVGVCGTLNGLFRLNSPWREHASLRFSLEEYDRLKLHCFRGDEGVTLVYYQGLNFAWTAYQTHRQSGAPQPDRYILAATDGGRGLRTESRYGGPYEVRFRNGELFLQRGDVTLVRAPFAGPPTEAYFDGQAVFTGLALAKTEDFPIDPLPPLEAASEIKPSQLAWKPHLAEGAEFKSVANGAVELTANKAKQRGYVAAPVPGQGLREIVLKIEAASPGTGVFLGRGAEGNPVEVVKFLHDQRTGKLGLSLHGDDDTHERQFESVDERTTALVPEAPWLKLLFGCGILRCWLSADGVHWSEPFFDPRTNLPGDVTHLGLHVVGNREACTLRVGAIHVRPLPPWNGLVEESVRDRAVAFQLASDYGDWLAKISAAQPPEIETAIWRRACAVKTLAAGCAYPLGDALANAILDDAQASLPIDRQLALLDEAALLLDLRSDANRLTQHLARYRRLADQAQQAGERRPFSLVRRAATIAPVATPHQYRLGLEKPMRAELLELLDRGEWDEALRLCELLRFYRLDENLPFVAWARATAQRQTADQATEGLSEQRDVWRHPLVEELSKDAYNFLAEFQALLDSEAFDEAARMIAATEPQAATGVAADRRDPRLLISLPAAIRLAMRDWPPLSEVMARQFSDLALLRVRRAMNEGDEAGVRAAALQFDASPAAALAARWLGDRALSHGYFEQALSLYDRSERTADSSVSSELPPRKRLAGAMLGRDLGSAPSSNVEFGEVSLPAAEFETLVTQMRQRAAATPETVVNGAIAAPRIQDAPAPHAYAYPASSQTKLDGPSGNGPNELPRTVREGNIDWAARQLACVVEGETLYVNSRFHAAAYDLASGQRRWQSPSPPGKPARTHDWSLVPMRPLVTEKHLLARQLTGDGPVLVCLDKQNGQIAWTSTPPPGEWLASDPFVVQGRLLMLRVRPNGAREASFVLCDYDSATGEPRDQQELARLREPAWTARHVCEVAVVDDALVAVLGGCVVCADLTGGVRWMRKQLYIPPDEEAPWGGQYHEPPLVDGRRVFLAQPGVRSVECVDAETGRAAWTRLLPDVQRLLGLVDGRLIVETADGFLALQAETGETLWRKETPPRLEGQFCGPAGLMYVRQATGERDDVQPRPELVWLDPQTGEERASFLANDLKRVELRFGPLVAHKDRLWAFVGAGVQEPNRELLEFVPQGDASRVLPLANDPWMRHMAEPVRAAVARVLPNWLAFRGIAEKPAGYYPEQHGERDVLALDGTHSQPIVFGRAMAIPAGGQAKLRLRLAMDQLRASKLIVEFRGEQVWEQKLDEQTLGSRQWRDFEADLSSRAGQTGWLTVRLEADNEERFTAFWKRLEVAF